MENDVIFKTALLHLAKDGKVSCAQALALAQRQGVAPILVGKAADEAGLKITGCQLGCFDRKKER